MVDEQVARDPSMHVQEDAVLSLRGEPLLALPRLLAWHKPVGVLSTLRDPWGREGLEGALPPHLAGRFHAVGRLDKDTSGLLLFSRDGKLTQYLLHPRRQIPRTYRATIDVDPPADLVRRLAEGVETALGCFSGIIEGIEGRVGFLTGICMKTFRFICG